MRTVYVPQPGAVWSVRVEGPVSPGAPDMTEARRRLAEALEAAAHREATLGGDWCVIWGGVQFRSGALLQQTLWIDRSRRADDLAGVVAEHLTAAGFVAPRGPRAARADPDLDPRVLYLRRGDVALGLGVERPDLLRLLRVLELPRRDVAFEHRWRFRRQRCPSCGALDHPAALMGGMPTPEALLAQRLGEVAFEGCLVDPRERVNARCRRCGRDFQAR